jgi:opacity protein-like surface antigen
MALFLSPSNASAQRSSGLVEISHRYERHGAWLNFALGAGSENYQYSNDPGGWRRPEDLTKPTISFAMGGTVNPNFRLGGELNAWINDYTHLDGYGISETLVAGLLVGQVYPMRKMGLFFKGGLGISRSGTSVDGGGDTGETGFSYLYGAGYEIRLARNFFLTPAINYMRHSSTSGQDLPGDGGTLKERVWTIGVGVTFQPGR